MVVTVDELISKPFLNRPRGEKILIVRDGKPRPNLPFLTIKENVEDHIDEEFTAFDTAFYEYVEWLTGCSARQALFCWPCLLFKISKEIWNKNGITDLSDLNLKIRNHAKSISHIQSSLDLKLFLPQVRTEDPEVSEKALDVIKKNREMAGRVIDAISLVVTEQHQSEMGKGSYLNAEYCIKNLQLIRHYDIVKTGVIDHAVNLLRSSPKLANDMVGAITSVMKTSIQKDLYQSTFVSMILSEHPQEPKRSQISVVLRYLKGGEVCERFVEFFSMEGERTCNLICKHVNKVIKDYNISHNLLAYSLDGSVFLDLDIFNQYVNYVRSKEDILHFCHPYICFIPCYFHKLDYVLRQSLSVSCECDIFFKNLEALVSCFQKGSKMREEFQTFYVAKCGEIPPLDIFSPTDYTTVFEKVKLYRKYCICFFEEVLESCRNKTEDDLVKIRGLCAFLKDFRNIFLLQTFSKFFYIILPLSEALYSTDSENTLDPILVERVYKAVLNEEKGDSFLEKLQIEKTFENLFESAIMSFEETEKPVVEKGDLNEKYDKSVYSTLYLNISRCIGNQIKCRFLNDHKVIFYNILNFKKRGKCLNSNFVKKLALAYESCFNYANLEKEMTSLENNQAILACESAHQMVKVFLKSGLNHSCPNVYKLIELQLTLPCSLSSLKDCSSKLRDLTTWSNTPDEVETFGDVSLMAIESDYLEEIRKKFSFHDEVMIRFQNKNKDLQLM